MWSHDYCTVCDKQCAPGTMYCSDACRVNELHKSSEVSSTSDNVYSTLYTTCRHHSLSSPLPVCEGPNCTFTTCICGSQLIQHTSSHNHRHSSTSSSSSSSIRGNDYEEEYYFDSETMFYNYDGLSNPTTPELSPALTASSASPLSIRSDRYLYSKRPTSTRSSSSSNGTNSRLSPPPSPLMIPTSYNKGHNGDSKVGHYHHHANSLNKEFTNTSTNYRRWLSAV